MSVYLVQLLTKNLFCFCSLFRPAEPGCTIMAAKITAKPLPAYIDHTLLRVDASEDDLATVCREAREHSFYSVCVYWNQVAKIAPLLAGSSVQPIAVVGFPSGEVPTEIKVSETHQAIADGAREIDMVLKRSLLFAGDEDGVETDIAEVVRAAGKTPVKVILETAELSDDQKRTCCSIARRAGASFVKTSTGFSPAGGATAADVVLMRAEVGAAMGVKASGGIRSTETALQMIEAGASRLGTSASVAIVLGQAGGGGEY
jgi:deoxyribose-phosphate aldolase